MTTKARIKDTLELFALQQTALTLLEVWKFLVRPAAELNACLSAHRELVEVPVLENRTTSVAEVYSHLAAMVRSGEVVEYFGFYALVRHKDLLKKRWLGYGFGIWREKRIRKFAKGLRYIPFVRGVALAGSQALGLGRKESDIDLLIVTALGWLWLPRTITTSYFQLLGIRRHGGYVSDRVCLNHYLSGPKQMSVGRNWYTAIEYAKLRPLFGEGVISAFQKANEVWISLFFPNYIVKEVPDRKAPRLQRFAERLLRASVGQHLERFLGDWQAKRIHKNEPHIIVAADELSFHPNSKQDMVLGSYR